MSYKLIQRFGTPCRFKATNFNSFDEAVWVARESNDDYVIDEAACGVASARTVKYRVNEFEMG